MVARRAFARLSDRSMAVVLERYFPQFDESLITAVELADRDKPSTECNLEMLAETCRLAAEPVDEIRFRRVFDPGPLRTSILVAVVLVGMIGLFAARYDDLEI